MIASAPSVIERPPDKPSSTGVSAEYPLAQAARVISRFDIPSPVEVYDFAEKGNINRHTFLVVSGAGVKQEYLLQQVNQQVFVRPRNVMAAMIAAIDAQRAGLKPNPAHQTPPLLGAGGPLLGAGGPDDWEAITLVPLHDGSPYLEMVDRRGVTCWRLMVKIPDAVTFKSLSEIDDPTERLRVAREAGRGLAMFGDLTSSVDATKLANPLPGYRDSRNYYNQLFSILEGHRALDQATAFLPADAELLDSTGRHFLVHLPDQEYRKRMDDPEMRGFIDLARAERDFGLSLARAMESGAVRTVAIHGDTKLDNFLFSAGTGRVKAMVDLDTIMPHTWLADWGDMARSLVNVAGEKETDLSQVRVDMDIYRALAGGFLGAAREVTSREVELMVDSVQLIALELGVRFLADYLRGDTYFQLGPADAPDLNKTRAMVQLTLFQLLRNAADECRAIIRDATA